MQEKSKKEEIMYNASALTSVWLEKYTKIDDLLIVLNNKTTTTTIPCSKESCGTLLGQVLSDNTQGYTKAAVVCKIGGRDKVIAELDIN